MSDATWADVHSIIPELTFRCFDHWVTKSYIHTDDDHPSRGFPRTLTWDEVDVLVLMADLVTAGMTPSAAAPLARQLAAVDVATIGRFNVSRAS